MIRTVDDFRTMVFARIGVGPENYEQFIGTNPARIAFWRKLNRLGGRRIEQFPPEKVPNIDATVELSEAERAKLECELDALLKSA